MQDVQSSTVVPTFALESVGVMGIDYPVVIVDPHSGERQATSARWRLGVALPAERRGTHMSRFVAALADLGETPLDLDRLYEFAQELTPKLAAEEATVEATFIWFRRVEAPVSKLAAFSPSNVSLKARTGTNPFKTLSVQVAAKALCPCSKAISDRGAHNQRSEISVTLNFTPTAKVPAMNRILSLLEASASSPVYPLLKRDDEKFVTESAYDNPVFVEDIVRGVAGRLADVPELSGFVVEAVNRESIHAHDCYARIVWERPKSGT